MRGLFQGDVNICQYETLQYLYFQDIKDKYDLEKERMKYTIISGNIELYKALFDEKQEELNPDVQWLTPRNAEEAEQLIAMLDIPRIGSE